MNHRVYNLLHWINLWQMGVVWVLAILYSYLKIYLSKGSQSESPNPEPENCGNPCSVACIVTGASTGIGKATAEALALKGYYVILAGRSVLRLQRVIEELEGKHSCIRVKAMELDLTSGKSIANFVSSVEKTLETAEGTLSLQLLINNAGILATTERRTSEGHDCMIMTNYLGHYMLTKLLLPTMQRSTKPARIVNMGSFTHHFHRCSDILSHLRKDSTGQKTMSFINPTELYKIAHIYETSKLFMIMFSYELHWRLRSNPSTAHISAMVADPGLVSTEILRELPRWYHIFVDVCYKLTGLAQTPSNGCRAVVDAALAPSHWSGLYFFGGCGRTLTSSPLSHNKKLAGMLWTLSEKLTSEALQ